jgi:hypothetical protein
MPNPNTAPQHHPSEAPLHSNGCSFNNFNFRKPDPEWLQFLQYFRPLRVKNLQEKTEWQRVACNMQDFRALRTPRQRQATPNNIMQDTTQHTSGLHLHGNARQRRTSTHRTLHHQTATTTQNKNTHNNTKQHKTTQDDTTKPTNSVLCKQWERNKS